MDISKFLAKVVGIYLLILTTAYFFNMQHFNTNLDGLIANAPAMLVVGFFTLIIGLLMVISHNVWVWNWRVLITIIAWIALLKGASIIYFPGVVDKMSLLFIKDTTLAQVAISIDFLIGILLTYCGFKR